MCLRRRFWGELQKFQVVKVVKKSGYNKTTKIRDYTGELTLTFNCDSSSKPEEVKCAYIHMKVEPYTPKPLLCRKCYQFANHLTDQCDHEGAICSWCGKEKHVEEKKPGGGS